MKDQYTVSATNKSGEQIISSFDNKKDAKTRLASYLHSGYTGISVRDNASTVKPVQTYQGHELLDVPSGMGGTLPAAVASDRGDTLEVVCLHDEILTNWVFTVKRSETRAMTYQLTDAMRKIIEDRGRWQRGGLER